MKKIVSKNQLEKKNQRNQIIIGLILIGLMLLSTAGYALTSNENENTTDEKVTYNNIQFIRSLDYWKFNARGYEFYTKYNPVELNYTEVIITNDLEGYKGQTLYISSGNGEPNSELIRNIDNRILLRAQKACLNNENCTNLNLPIKDCNNDNLVVFKEPKQNEKERVYQDNKCIIIVSSQENQTAYTDAFLFKLLNI
ncbi:MAG: hypothetical protein WC867_07690 [Candidatus Pacearchaeota archaeon]|jgi:hypothetical protein